MIEVVRQHDPLCRETWQFGLTGHQPPDCRLEYRKRFVERRQTTRHKWRVTASTDYRARHNDSSIGQIEMGTPPLDVTKQALEECRASITLFKESAQRLEAKARTQNPATEEQQR
jgi:hypothetical protein